MGDGPPPASHLRVVVGLSGEPTRRTYRHLPKIARLVASPAGGRDGEPAGTMRDHCIGSRNGAPASETDPRDSPASDSLAGSRGDKSKSRSRRRERYGAAPCHPRRHPIRHEQARDQGLPVVRDERGLVDPRGRSSPPRPVVRSVALRRKAGLGCGSRWRQRSGAAADPAAEAAGR